MTPPSVRPRLYGYFSVLKGWDDAALHDARQTLADFAERGGFELVDIYEDDGPGHRLQTWHDMVGACRAEDVPALVVVSMDHFHTTPELAAFMRDDLATAIQGTVFVASETHSGGDV